MCGSSSLIVGCSSSSVAAVYVSHVVLVTRNCPSVKRRYDIMKANWHLLCKTRISAWFFVDLTDNTVMYLFIHFWYLYNPSVTQWIGEVREGKHLWPYVKHHPGSCLEELWDTKKFGRFNYLRFESWVSRIRIIIVNHTASEFCVPCCLVSFTTLLGLLPWCTGKNLNWSGCGLTKVI